MKKASAVENIERAATIIQGSRDVLVFTGAGISAASGIPTFRGRGGLWEQYDPAIYGNIPGLGLTFLIRRRRIHEFARDALSAFVEAEPNQAHYAIAELERMGKTSAVVTQNVDDLHRRAGSLLVLEVHGSVYRLRCFKCGAKMQLERATLIETVARLEKGPPNRRQLLRTLRDYTVKCPCGGRTRPDVVLFGESLPGDAMNEAIQRARECDCLLAVGTSALVYPAASIPQVAIGSGSKLIEVNPDPSRLTAYADVVVAQESERVLPRILEMVKSTG